MFREQQLCGPQFIELLKLYKIWYFFVMNWTKNSKFILKKWVKNNIYQFFMWARTAQTHLTIVVFETPVAVVDFRIGLWSPKNCDGGGES